MRAFILGLERVTGIEPAFKAWEALILPLNYTRNVYGIILYEKLKSIFFFFDEVQNKNSDGAAEIVVWRTLAVNFGNQVVQTAFFFVGYFDKLFVELWFY